MTTRGWCPSLFEPMEACDGLLLRVKPPAGRLTAKTALLVADAALRHGNGAIELTNRGNLQFRGFTPDGARAFASVAVSAGLACADPAAERRRNVMVGPLADRATVALALALEAAIVADAALAGLPAKFGFVVDGGETPGLAAMTGDVTLRRMPAPGPPRWRVISRDDTTICAAADAVAEALRLASAAQRVVRSTPVAPVSVGPLPGGAFGIGVPPGRLDGHGLAALARLAARHADGQLRLTPWRSVVLVLPADPASGALPPGLVLPGLIMDAADPLLRVACCIGAPGCVRASVTASADAARLAPHVPPGSFLHVSGCAKGCSHPGPASWTLVGEAGGYGLIREGRASDRPTLRGLDVDAAAELLHEAAGPTTLKDDAA